MLTFELIECFLSIVDAGGVSKAAERLGISQPAVSQRLRRLEDLIGRRVVRRDMAEDRLTPEGLAFLPHARTVMHAMEGAQEHLRHPLLTGSARLGITEDITQTRLPGLLGCFRRLHPGVHLRVDIGLSGDLLDALGRGELDLVISKRTSGRGSGRPLWSEALSWVVAPDHAGLVRQRPLPLALHPHPSVTAEAVGAALRHARIDGHVMVTSRSIAGLRAAALAGLGVTAFGRSSMPAGLEMVPLSDLPPLPNLEFSLERGTALLSRAAEALEGLILAEMASVGSR